MISLFDTSTVIALIVSDHPNHSQANKMYMRMKSSGIELSICTHSLAEIYRTLTWGKSYLSFSADQAQEIINDSILQNFGIIDLVRKDYEEVISRLKKSNLTGAIIYDALIAQAASKIGADYLITFNFKDFEKVLPKSSIELISPLS